MQSEEVFLVSTSPAVPINADSLLHLVKTSLLSFGIPLTGIRSQGYDGASNMSGKNNGLQAKVIAENPKALYLYCLGHQLAFINSSSHYLTRTNECGRSLYKKFTQEVGSISDNDG